MKAGCMTHVVLMLGFIVDEELCESDSSKLIHLDLSRYQPQLSPKSDFFVGLLLLYWYLLHFHKTLQFEILCYILLCHDVISTRQQFAHTSLFFPFYLPFTISSSLSFVLFPSFFRRNSTLSLAVIILFSVFFFLSLLCPLAIHPSSLLFDRACVLFLSQ